MKTEIDAELGLRARKKQRTRDALAAAASDLFGRDGFEQTTVEAVAEVVMVSKRTFFRYFPSKEAAAVAAEVELWEAVEARVEAAAPASGTVVDLIRRSMLDALRDMPEDWPDRFFRSRVLIAHNPSVRAESLRAADEAQRRLAKRLGPRIGVDDNDPELRIAVEIGFAAWRTAARIWVSGRKRDKDGPLLGFVEEAFEAVPASITLAARH